eukprot:CAMPEP_0184498346 /NCGR_PEP_ID=MMETSP0113_2-20130426/38713_1 /TAXON_ID=91329 /ORGANISM="Norrisiella sphaerica, Strain BC52" /LENGTH=55 /DNA_ID=CAMNT_0026885809 /DNA_START=151 /DNA_END=318 /DNA_ORIENTATION=+
MSNGVLSTSIRDSRHRGVIVQGAFNSSTKDKWGVLLGPKASSERITETMTSSAVE